MNIFHMVINPMKSILGLFFMGSSEGGEVRYLDCNPIGDKNHCMVDPMPLGDEKDKGNVLRRVTGHWGGFVSWQDWRSEPRYQVFVLESSITTLGRPEGETSGARCRVRMK